MLILEFLSDLSGNPCLRDAEDDEDVAEGGEEGEEDDGEAPIVDGQSRCRIEAVEEEATRTYSVEQKNGVRGC